jgi:hypothetical protein
MLLYCNATQVISTHDDDQNVKPSLYGPGVQVIPVPDGTLLARIGPPPPPRTPDSRPYAIPAPTTDLLVAYAAYKRWLTMIAGTTVASLGGAAVLTDDNSQAKVAACKQAFDTATITTATFKLPSGSFVAVNASQIAAIYAAIVAHVQACYASEGAAVSAINAGTATTYSAVDAFFSSIT